MQYLKLAVIFLTLLATINLPASIAQARTTPEDIFNAKKDAYQQKVSKYSTTNQQKLDSLSQKIAEVNRIRSAELLQISERQGEILDEYLIRQEIIEQGGRDGINRNLSDPIEKTRYWITYAHEAAAYQAAKIYIYSLTSESNIKSDSLNLISTLQADLNSTRQKVINSQKILNDLLKIN